MILKEDKIRALNEVIKKCERCPLSRTRTHAVPGEGNIDAKILMIGEAPGMREDSQGKCFVGRAGKVLNNLLDLVGLKREEIFIVNSVLCRPPNNRNPTSQELKACSIYLNAYLSMIKPRVIIPLGNFALGYILQKYGMREEKISRIHGESMRIGDIEIIPMFHPAASLYDPRIREVIEEDFKILKRIKG